LSDTTVLGSNHSKGHLSPPPSVSLVTPQWCQKLRGLQWSRVRYSLLGWRTKEEWVPPRPLRSLREHIHCNLPPML